MAKPNKNNADTTTLAGRLAFCMASAGGKKQLAAATGISEAQLFRYMNTISDMPVSKLVAISEASGVDVGWLLSGEVTPAPDANAPKTPPFRPALMQYVARMLDEFLVEYQKPIPPRLKSGLLTLIYEALRHEEVLSGQEVLPSKFQFLSILNFVTALRSEEEIEVYRESMRILETERSNIASSYLLFQSFSSLVTRGHSSYYESFSGQAYFERVGQQTAPETEMQIHQLVKLTLDHFKNASPTVLDLGCGNGRYLEFIHKNYPKLNILGLDVATQAVELCQRLEKNNKIPQGSTSQGSLDELPYTDQSIEAVFCNFSLHNLPYLPGLNLGMNKAWQEIQRVLKPNGFVWMGLPYGGNRTYGLFSEMLDLEEFNEIAKSHGFEVIHTQTRDLDKEQPPSVRACTPWYLSKVLNVLLRKIN